MLSPAHATAGGGVDRGSMCAVVLVPVRRLLAADLHADGRPVLLLAMGECKNKKGGRQEGDGGQFSYQKRC